MKHLRPTSGFQFVYRTPAGFDNLVLVSDGEAVTGVFFEGSEDADRVVAARPERPPQKTTPRTPREVFQPLSAWLDVYFSGRDPGPPPAWRTPGLSPFARRVQEAMLAIPWGGTRTYGDIAAEIARERGVPRVSAQAVGQAVGSNPLCLLVPCHRVVGAGGRLVGYGGGLANKAALLRLEGHAGGDTRPGRAPAGSARRPPKRICVSACLLGVPCRWKGDAKPCEGVLRLAARAVVRALDPATRRAMEKHHAESAEFVSHAESAENAEVELFPFCPELAAGLGCPRPPIELVQGAVSNPSTASTISTSSTLQPRGLALPIRVLRVDRKGDATDALRAACEAETEALERAGGVDGFVLKARSPSCGLASPLHDAAGREIGTAPGLWAALAAERFPSAERVDEAHFSRDL